MRVGLHTLSWGPRFDQIAKQFHRIKDLGYQGIELAQLIETPPDADELFGALASEKLSLVGVSGGTLDDKVRLAAKASSIQPDANTPYVYADEWDDELDLRYQALLGKESDEELYRRYKTMHGDEWDEELDLRFETLLGEESDFDGEIPIAIHPHMFKPIQTSAEAYELIQEFDYLRFLPDIAHLRVAGEHVLSSLSNHFEWTIAVHLKDWSPEFGRTLPFYSRGFVELGRGQVPVEDVLAFLKDNEFDGWVIVEQDYTVHPQECAERSREYLRRCGI